MKHRYEIKSDSKIEDIIHHKLELQRSGDKVFLYCKSHQKTVVMFYPHHAEFMYVSCMRHRTVKIPFDIHVYRDVEDANKKE